MDIPRERFVVLLACGFPGVFLDAKSGWGFLDGRFLVELCRRDDLVASRILVQFAVGIVFF